jgi:cephalosporin-C deacetylase-like acetyl esterase
MAANPTQTRQYEIDVQDVEYVRHGDQPILARVLRPRGNGPFPGMVEVHGAPAIGCRTYR